MKKIICFLTVFALILTYFGVYAEGECTISADSVFALPGGTASVPINIENNPGMALGQVKISFDSSKLIPTAVSKKGILSGAYQFTSNLEDENVDVSELGYVTISWVNALNISGDGEIAEVEFAAADENVEEADITIEVIELANADEVSIDCVSANGKVMFAEQPTEDDDKFVLGFADTTITRRVEGIDVNATLSAYSPEPVSASFIYAVYSGSTLAAVKTADVSLNVGVNEIPLGDLKAKGDDMFTVKVFMWNSLADMTPLTTEPLSKTYR